MNHKVDEVEVKHGLGDKKGGKKKNYKISDGEVSRVDVPDENLGGLFNQ